MRQTFFPACAFLVEFMVEFAICSDKNEINSPHTIHNVKIEM